MDVIPKQTQTLDMTTSISSKVIVVSDDENDTESDVSTLWVQIGAIKLYNIDKEGLHEGKWLSDTHLNALQLLLKLEFPHINGLQNTLTMNTAMCKPLPEGSLQILHVNGNHWITVSTSVCNGTDISVLDSKYLSLTKTTITLLSKLVRSMHKTFTVQIGNTIKQSGDNDCGLFASAYATSLAFGHDPCSFVYDQRKMREHLFRCLQEKRIEPFPYIRLRRKGTPRIQTVEVYCYCRCPDNGNAMVLCDGEECGEWFHTECVDTPFNKGDKCGYV